MASDQPFPDRKRPVRADLRQAGNRAAIVFITVTTKQRKPLLAREEIHQLMLSVWNQADAWVVGHYVILPDHLHLFCSPGSHEPVNVRSWIKYWKRLATQKWPRDEDKPLWQQDAWDRQLSRRLGTAALP